MLSVEQPAAAQALAGRILEATMVKIMDFSAGSVPWRNIDDRVMGGVSSSRMVIADGVAIFSGVVSLERNGGFASVRSTPGQHDLGDFDGLVLRVLGDGNRYSVRVRTEDSFDGVSYQAKIEPAAGEWQEVFVPFDRFQPVYRGRLVAGYRALDPAAIRSFGLLIADKQSGPFRLEIEWIAGIRITGSDGPDEQ
jgi:monofunctional biosynthetic peptidoglycan transglycosylase